MPDVTVSTPVDELMCSTPTALECKVPLKLHGATSGSAIIRPSDATTPHTLILPPSLGPGGGALSDPAGDGNLAWVTPPAGDVVGPAGAVDDRIATFNGATGKAIKDSGKLVSDLGDVKADGTSVDGRIATYKGATGKLIQDSGRLISSVGDVTGPAGAVADRIAVFNGTTGKLLKDGGKTVAELPVGDVTAAAAFGTTNRIVRSDGTGKGVKGSMVTVNDLGVVQATAFEGDGSALYALQADQLEGTVPDAVLPANIPRKDAANVFTGAVEVPDEAYDASGWNADLSVPTKNAVRDKIEAVVATIPTGVPTIQTAYLTGAEQTTTSPTAVDVTGMLFDIGAGETWAFTFNLVLSVSAAGASMKFALACPAGASVAAQVRGSSNAAIISAPGTLTSGTMSSSTGSAIISGVVTNGGTPGVVQLQFASGDGIATARIGLTSATGKLGNHLIATKLA